MTFPRRCWLITLSLTGILLTYGCAAARYMGRAERAARAGDWDRALQYCFEALRRDPDNLKYQATCRRMRLAAAEMHFQRAEALVEKNPDDIPTLEQAVLEYQLAVQSDPTHQLAAARLESTILKLQRLKEQRAEAAMEIERAKEKIARAAVLPKILHSEELIDVKYVDTSLRQILDSMAKGFGVNVIYDKDFQDTRYSVELRGVTFQEALQQILAANGLFYKVVSENTIMVIPDNPQKRRQHEELVVRTFYLSNADLNETMNLLRVIAGIQQIVPNTQLNAITVKDTPEKVALAERIIRLNDKAQAELILDVEILEVSRQTAARYGIDIVPEIAVTQTLDIGQGPGVIFGHQFRAIDAAAWAFTFPSIVYRALITDASTRVLARPQIRAADGKSMSVRLGNRVPIPTTTFTGITPTQPGQPPPAGGVIVPITSFQLVDIGINLDVKPRIHHNLEVTLDLKFELTSIAAPGRQINEPPTLGSRVVNTTIRLKNGETNLLAGCSGRTNAGPCGASRASRTCPSCGNSLPPTSGTLRRRTSSSRSRPTSSACRPSPRKTLSPFGSGRPTNPVFGNPRRIRSSNPHRRPNRRSRRPRSRLRRRHPRKNRRDRPRRRPGPAGLGRRLPLEQSGPRARSRATPHGGDGYAGGPARRGHRRGHTGGRVGHGRTPAGRRCPRPYGLAVERPGPTGVHPVPGPSRCSQESAASHRAGRMAHVPGRDVHAHPGSDRRSRPAR